mmetsp:Transcript_27419/g.57003  ORF Transcript_27419/g.57003 Transcript_27419/m.57003 type:complete len:229 (-) Transcript_27419:336-1022(-)
MDFVRTFVCVPKAIVETQVGTLCNLLEDDVVKIIDSTTSSRWWSEHHAEKSVTSGETPETPDQPVSRPKGRRMSLLEKLSEVYETELEVLGNEYNRAQGTGSGPKHVIDHSQFRQLLQNDSFPQNVEQQPLQPSTKPRHFSKMKFEKPVVTGPTQQSRNKADISTRGFKQRYALLADDSRKAATEQQARLVRMQTESYIQRQGIQSAPDSKLMISGAGRRARRPHPTD